MAPTCVVPLPVEGLVLALQNPDHALHTLGHLDQPVAACHVRSDISRVQNGGRDALRREIYGHALDHHVSCNLGTPIRIVPARPVLCYGANLHVVRARSFQSSFGRNVSDFRRCFCQPPTFQVLENTPTRVPPTLSETDLSTPRAGARSHQGQPHPQQHHYNTSLSWAEDAGAHEGGEGGYEGSAGQHAALQQGLNYEQGAHGVDLVALHHLLRRDCLHRVAIQHACVVDDHLRSTTGCEAPQLAMYEQDTSCCEGYLTRKRCHRTYGLGCQGQERMQWYNFKFGSCNSTAKGARKECRDSAVVPFQ